MEFHFIGSASFNSICKNMHYIMFDVVNVTIFSMNSCNISIKIWRAVFETER